MRPFNGAADECFCHQRDIMSDTTSSAPTARKRSFAAMRHPGFRAQFITYVLAMMADNIEHVIS